MASNIFWTAEKKYINKIYGCRVLPVIAILFFFWEKFVVVVVVVVVSFVFRFVFFLFYPFFPTSLFVWAASGTSLSAGHVDSLSVGCAFVSLWPRFSLRPRPSRPIKPSKTQ